MSIVEAFPLLFLIKPVRIQLVHETLNFYVAAIFKRYMLTIYVPNTRCPPPLPDGPNGLINSILRFIFSVL